MNMTKQFYLKHKLLNMASIGVPQITIVGHVDHRKIHKSTFFKHFKKTTTRLIHKQWELLPLIMHSLNIAIIQLHSK